MIYVSAQKLLITWLATAQRPAKEKNFTNFSICQKNLKNQHLMPQEMANQGHIQKSKTGL